jgi:hypothetical protein
MFVLVRTRNAGEPGRAAALPGGLFVLSLAGPRICAVTRFQLDELHPRFGLPESLPPGDDEKTAGAFRVPFRGAVPW